MHALTRARCVCLRAAYTATLVLCIAWPAGVFAQTYPSEVTRGLAWLAARLQPDGTLGGESGSLATILQARTEAAFTFAQLGSASGVLVDGLPVGAEETSEDLARRALALALAGRNAAPVVSSLLARQNADGGFPGPLAFASSTLDTAWALIALTRGGGPLASAASARGYLLRAIQSDGGMPGATEAERIHVSALALAGLQLGTLDLASADAIRRLSAWLVQRQGLDGGWLGDAYLSAVALAGLAPVSADASIRNRARLYLGGLQAADGSWNDDPFLTAVALRALVLEPVEQPVLPARLTGRVLDQATGNVLPGAAIALSGTGSAAATADGTGAFLLADLKPGGYAVRIDRAGYGPVSANLALNPGQALDLGNVFLAPAATSGIVRGVVTAAASGGPLAGVQITLQGSANLSAISAADGRFEFTGVPPGSLTVTASFAGYQTASGTAAIAAGQVLLFSPALFSETEPPPAQGRFVGTVAALGTQSPLAGVSVRAGPGNAATTGADGAFALSLAPGEYTVTYSLDGFEPAAQHFVLSAGTELSGGVILLTPQRSATLLRGSISDGGTGAALPGARIEVRGGPAVTAEADGKYLVDGLIGDTFDLSISATGYLTQLATLKVARPSEVVQDFALQRQTAPGMSLASLDAQPAVARSRTLIVAQTTVSNTGSEPGSAVLRLEVSDASGTIVGEGLAYAPNGADPIGLLALAPGESAAAELRWDTAQFPAGTYTLAARLVEPGSLTAANPSGRLIAELADSVQIIPDLHFRGSLTVDPPVLRAGTNTSVKLSAVLQNDGNTELPAQSYALRIVQSQSGAVVFTQEQSGSAFAPNALQSLDFADWLPADGGDYRVELQAADAQLGKLETPVYVGDSARAAFTLNRTAVAPGTQTVRGKVRVEGQDVATGTISDPLAPLVRAAIQKAVSYADSYAVAHSVNDLRCFACHVQTQALLGGELNRRLAPADEKARRTLLNFLTTTQNADGSSGHDGFKASSMLTLWAINAWQRKEQVVSTQLDVARYLRNRQDADGGWTSDHGFAWWRTRVALTGINVKSFIELRGQLAELTAPPAQQRPTAWAPGNGLTDSYLSLAGDASGALYTAGYSSGTLMRRNADGTRETLITGLSGPQSIAVAPDGTVYVATNTGVYRRLPDGSTTRWSTQRATGVALTPAGALFAASYSDNAIYQIAPDGTASVWMAGGALRNPYGITALDDALYVTSYGGAKVLRLAPDKTMQEVVPWTRGSPRHLIRANGAWWLTTEEGFYVYDDEWVGERLDTNRGFGVTRLADGTILYTANSLISTLSSVATDLSAEIAALDASIDRATNWLLVDSNVATGNNLDIAQRLIGLGSARSFYDGTARAAALQSKMEQVAAVLRARQRSDGGWPWTTQSVSDSLVTAQVGVALDYLNPSPSSPEVRKAVELLLSRQRADGTWISENGVSSPALIASTWVEIWLPTMLNRLGGIDTDLTLALPANVMLANPTLPPLTAVDDADAGKTFTWRLPGVTSGGRDLEFDLTFVDLALGEQRRAAREAFLTFNNTFTNQPLDAPIAIPALLGSAFLELAVATDQASYGAGSPVGVSALVHNSAEVAGAGSVRLQVFAADSTLVADLGRAPFADLSAGAQRTLAAGWNTGSSYAGPYYALGTLYDAQDRLVASARADFQIIATASPGSPSANASIATDRQRYAPNDTVRVRDHLSNASLNAPLENLQVVTSVTNPDGTMRWTRSEILTQLLPEALRDYEYSIALGGAPSGQYLARLSVQSTAGIELAVASATFEVASTADAGRGIGGRITATPRRLPSGETVILDYEIANVGNADLADLPVSVAIVDPVSNATVASFEGTQSLAQGQSVQLARTWQTAGAVGTTYVAVLYATLNGTQRTLAQDSFTLSQRPVDLDVRHGVASEARVLALVACPQPGRDDKHHRDAAKARDGDEHARGAAREDSREHGHPSEHAQHEDGGEQRDRDRHEHDGQDQECVAHRVGVLQTELTALGIEQRVVSDEPSFLEALRCGRYNTYWISGAAGKLSDVTVKELRAAVRRGDSLLVDAMHDERNRPLDEVLGVRFKGKRSDRSLTVALDGTLLPAARLAAAPPGQRFVLAGGTAEGTFADGSPAIVRNGYGQGKGLIAAFDLVGSLEGSASAAWRILLDAMLGYLGSTPATVLVENAFLPLRTGIANRGAAVELQADTAIPAGARPLQTRPQAQTTVDGFARWRFALPEGASQQLRLDLRVPQAGGAYALPTTVGYVSGAQVLPYASYPLDVQVVGLDELLARAVEALDRLQPTSKAEREKLATARKEVRDVRAAIERLDFEEAIRESVDAIDLVLVLDSVDAGSARAELDRLLQALELRWCRTGCDAFVVTGSPAAVHFELASRSASLRSEFGIFALDGSDGRVGGKWPADAGYASAALAAANTIFRGDARVGAKVDLQLERGAFYGFYLIQGDSRTRFLERNPDNRSAGKPLAFFADPNANPDGFAHLRTTTLSDGRLRLQWEDLSGGGDQDFDDLILETRSMQRCERP